MLGDAARDGLPAPDDSSAEAGASHPIVTTGFYHSCVLLTDGTVKCWGGAQFGQLGTGATDSLGDQPGEMGAALPTVSFGVGRKVLDISAGFCHTCALLDDHSVKCWGCGSQGQLGLDDANDRGHQPGELGASLPAVNLGAGRSALAISAGNSHSCALLDDHRIKCWGLNSFGQLGLGDKDSRGDSAGEMAALPAVDLGAGRTALAVSAGSYQTCALLDDHSVKCWGRNAEGELGVGDMNSRGDGPSEMGASLPPIDLGAGRTALQVSAGHVHVCALLDDHSIKCWGANDFGGLGLSDVAPRGIAPGQMGGALPILDLGPGRTALTVAAQEYATCAILDDHSLKCWGRNAEGQLGLGDVMNRGATAGTMGASLPAVDLGPGRTVRSVSRSQRHVCAVLDDDKVKCWGTNERGELGLGDVQSRGMTANMGAKLAPLMFE